jgi:hypothetical protein
MLSMPSDAGGALTREQFIEAAQSTFGWPPERAEAVWEALRLPRRDFLLDLDAVCRRIVLLERERQGS